MKKLNSGLLLCACLLAIACSSQNLVPNPSFENGPCVVSYNSTPGKIPTTMDHWYSCTGASPDPFDTCGTFSTIGYDIVVPDIIFGYQYARTGARFMGLGFYSGWYEYIGTKLTEPLEAGETYKVSFWVSCADMMLWATKEIGMYFSTSEISFPTTSTYGGMLNYTPQVSTNGNFLTDTLWQEVTGEFVAAGGEQWIVMGYFKPMVKENFYLFPDPGDGRKPKANPDYKPTVAATGTAAGPRLYYYIDDVSVTKVDITLPIRLSAFSGNIVNQSVRLQWKTEMEENNCRFEIERSTNGVDFTLIGTVAGARNSSITQQYNFTDPSPVAGRNLYRLRQVDCDGRSTYSRVITIRYDLAGFSVYPNPVADDIIIDRNKAGSALVTVYDMTGRSILTQKITALRESIAVRSLLPGSYIVKVEDETGGVSAQKIIKK